MTAPVMPKVKFNDPQNDVPIAWELAIRRVTDAKREDEVTVRDELVDLGVETAGWAMVLSKNPTGGDDSKKMLAELFTAGSPEYVKARLNSLMVFREYYGDTGKHLNLSLLNKVLNGADNGAIVDHGEEDNFDSSLALIHTTLTMTEKRGDFEDRPRVEDTGDAIVLNPAITKLINENPERYKAIIELIVNRWISTTDRVLEMLNVSEANSMMDGAL